MNQFYEFRPGQKLRHTFWRDAARPSGCQTKNSGNT